jgi:exonuclease V
MASPAPATDLAGVVNNDDSDYGSDFSPEEEQIVERLLSAQIVVQIEDNPIVTQVENHDAKQSLRLPRILGREQRSLIFEAARAAEKVAQQISDSVTNGEHYPDCEFSFRLVF